MLIVKPNSVANLMARIIRRASSLNLSEALPTARRFLSFMSFRPLNGSTTSFIAPFDRLTAMAFIVKSRRLRSVFNAFTEFHLIGVSMVTI